MTKEELKNIIRDHCSENDKKEFIQWVQSENFDSDLESFITNDLETELSQKHQIEDADLSKMAANILTKAKDHDNAISEKEHSISYYSSDWQKRSRANILYRVAATLLLIALFAFVAFYFTQDQTNENISQTIIKENQRGRKSTIFLKDGTIVYLNSESKIQYPEGFNDSIRVVQLDGEAYFDVARNVDKPFVVLTNELKVSVLGTSFNINAYAENEFVKVSLNTGKVEVHNEFTKDVGANKKIELIAGQSVSYSSKKNQFTEVSEFDPNLDLSWKDGKIVFVDATMETMISRFERWYNVDFVLKNKPYFNWDYTGEFQNQTLQDVLETLSFSQSFDYSIDQDKVELVFKPN